MALRVRQLETEQWVGSEWAVEKDGKIVYSTGAEEGKIFGRERCWFWILFHPGSW